MYMYIMCKYLCYDVVMFTPVTIPRNITCAAHKYYIIGGLQFITVGCCIEKRVCPLRKGTLLHLH